MTYFIVWVAVMALLHSSGLNTLAIIVLVIGTAGFVGDMCDARHS